MISSSVPSTAMRRPLERNGSSIFSISFSSARMPSRRALSDSVLMSLTVSIAERPLWNRNRLM